MDARKQGDMARAKSSKRAAAIEDRKARGCPHPEKSPASKNDQGKAYYQHCECVVCGEYRAKRNKDNAETRKKPERQAKRRESQRAWLEKNPTYYTDRYAANPEIKGYQLQWQRDNRGKCRESERRYRENHPEKLRLKDRRNDARRRAARPEFMKTDFMRRVENDFEKKKDELGLSLDHIDPVNNGGQHVPWNWSMSPLSENASKQDSFVGLTENAIDFNEAMAGFYSIDSYTFEAPPQHSVCLLPGIPEVHTESATALIGGY